MSKAKDINKILLFFSKKSLVLDCFYSHHEKMTLITEQELEHLAKLAKLKLSSEEKQKFLGTMGAIIDFLGQLENVEELPKS